MPYPPVLNPRYLQWEPWPHVYRRGMWINDVTAFPALGEAAPPEPTGSAVPWQCWDMPGFKECQASCFDKAQKTGVSAAAQSALVDQCFLSECVTPCKAKIQAAAAEPPKGGGTSSSASLLDKITASPINIAITALVLAVGATLLMPQKKGAGR